MVDLQSFQKHGFAITPPLLSSNELQRLVTIVEDTANPATGKGGVRDVADIAPELRALAEHPKVRELVEQVLGADAFVVRATLFDKTDGANWKVPWHQDVTIAVGERRDTTGYGPWSTKSGIQHVQPPSEVLERMVTVRVHLDPCPADNGALRVMPGTHTLGKLNQNHVSGFVNENKAVCCEVEAGGALVMRPLLLHASSGAKNPQHRRVVHFDFAADDLPNGLNWRMRNQPDATHQA